MLKFARISEEELGEEIRDLLPDSRILQSLPWSVRARSAKARSTFASPLGLPRRRRPTGKSNLSPKRSSAA
jgi:hypothetical protein